MRALLLLFALTLAAAPSGAAVPSLPVHRPGSATPAPCWAGDVLELRLAPSAARAVQPFGAARTHAGRVARLGVAALDAAAVSLGATFEPAFVGEAPPEPGSGATDFTAFQVVHLPPTTRLEDALARFRALPEVLSATPIAELPMASLPNDSLLSFEYWLYQRSLPRHDIGAPEAWDVEPGDTSIVIAILDSGVLPYHPDLAGTLPGRHGNLWVNAAEADGLPGVDDDGNGFVDDVWGWDFVALNVVDTLHADDLNDADADPNDYAGHGTMVAGITGAIANNGSGIAGTVPNVRLMAVRMGWVPPFGVRPESRIRLDFAAGAIRYATRMGARVINCSWTALSDPALDAALDDATRAGVILVAASGNSGGATHLGERADVISVAATDSLDQYQDFDITGPWLDLAAGGTEVTTTYLQGAGPDSLQARQPAYVTGFSGTSFASPVVAGAAALLQAQRLHAGRDPLTPLGMLLRLRETAVDVRALNTRFTDVAPRLDLFRALTARTMSTAVRTSSSSVGPPVSLRYNTGRTLVVIATNDQHLVAFDGATADTAWVATLPGVPAGNLAGARLGAGRPVGLFVGTTKGQVAGFDDAGHPLPGWPVTGLGATNVMAGGVALGDLDGDGVLDVVAMGGNGRVWAWRTDGTKFAGFPFATGTIGASAPALADVDGVPGDEILCVDGLGVLHAVDFHAQELWQYASAGNAAPPVVTRLGGPHAPLAIFLADPTQVAALDSTGSPGWTTPITTNTIAEPAPADIDGDGADELVLAFDAPTRLARIDSSGAVVNARGWPFVTGVDPAGPLVLGPLSAGHGVCPGFASPLGFVAFDDSGHVVPAFPKTMVPGTVWPALADVRGDGATQVVVGAGADSNACMLDAGAGTWNAAFAAWPTPRGNAARTGSRIDAGGPAVIDRMRPAAVTDLAGVALGTTSVRLTWTATGDDSLVGRASRVELRVSTAPITPLDFATATLVPTPAPDSAGTLDTLVVGGFAEGSLHYFALIAFDDEGQPSALGDVAAVSTTVTVPGGVADLRVTAFADTVAALAWTATGDDGATGRPASYEIAADLAPLDSARFESATVRATIPAHVDAGNAEQGSVPGLSRGQRWYFALRPIDHTGARGPLSNVAQGVVPTGGALRGRTGVAVAPRQRPSGAPLAIDWQGAGEGGPQSLAFVDLAGRVVRRVPLDARPGGSWTWDGRDGDGRLLPAGVYVVRLASGGRHADARVVLLR